jgi:ATP-dependent DNA helicase PIF1
MNLLSGAEMSFPAVDSGMVDEVTRSRLLENCIAPTNLVLKKGAQVMLIKNIDSQLVNGSQGTVTSFMDEACYHAYSEDPASFVKSQEDGSDDEIAAAKKRIQQLRHKDGTSTGTARLWPLVRFTLADNTCRSLLCVPEEWKSEAPNRDILARRMQVPLILAWALSIHKAQGQTIERVKVDLGRVFEKGQAYVALSRATTQAGLQVTRFDPRKVMVHPRVKEFYEGLKDVESILERKGESAGKPRMRGGAIEVVDLDGEAEEEDDEEDEEILRHMYA